MKIGFIGTGNMGGALARAAAKGGHTLLLANRTPAKAEALAKELCGTVCPNAVAAEAAELLFLGVKPQGLPGLAGELAPVLQARKGNAPVVVSMATAVTLRELDAMLGAAEMLLQGGEAPDVLKMRVCSPAGTTIEGVLALEQGGFSYTVQNAVTAAYRRTVDMTKKG